MSDKKLPLEQRVGKLEEQHERARTEKALELNRSELDKLQLSYETHGGPDFIHRAIKQAKRLLRRKK